MRISCLFLLFWLFSYQSGHAQEKDTFPDSGGAVVKPNRVIENNAFQTGEYLKFIIRYGPIKAGYAYMEIPEITAVNERSSYHIVSRAESNDFFSAFYKVRDKVESFMDSTGMFSWRFEKHLREGKYRADVKNIFDQENRKVITKKDTFAVPLYTQDVLSTLYFIRTQELKLGQSISVENFSDGKLYPLEVKILKKETVRVKAGKFPCIIVEPILRSTGIFQHKGRLKVWLTEDKTHTPVMMKSEIVVGSVVAELIEYKGVQPVKK